jgi:hypothetical protein
MAKQSSLGKSTKISFNNGSTRKGIKMSSMNKNKKASYKAYRGQGR